MLAAMAAGTALWGFAPEARAMDEIMPLEEVEAGMTGELFTVAEADRRRFRDGEGNGPAYVPGYTNRGNASPVGYA